jgi:hypothetical protein
MGALQLTLGPSDQLAKAPGWEGLYQHSAPCVPVAWQAHCSDWG